MKEDDRISSKTNNAQLVGTIQLQTAMRQIKIENCKLVKELHAINQNMKVTKINELKVENNEFKQHCSDLYDSLLNV